MSSTNASEDRQRTTERQLVSGSFALCLGRDIASGRSYWAREYGGMHEVLCVRADGFAYFYCTQAAWEHSPAASYIRQEGSK